MMNILEILKSRITTIYAKYLNNEEIELLPIHYIGGSQTLPPPLDSRRGGRAFRKIIKKWFRS